MAHRQTDRQKNLKSTLSFILIHHPFTITSSCAPQDCMDSGFLLKASLPISAAEPLRYKIHPQTVPCSSNENCVGNERLQSCILDDGHVVLFLG